MRILGLDFSINKPAACIFNDNKYETDQYEFFSWPFELREDLKKIYRESWVNIVDRTDEKYKGKDSSMKMRWEVQNANYISKEIRNLLFMYDDIKYVVFEGISYASTGNMAIQLGGYKYVLMTILNKAGIKWDNMYTYAPITLKKTAGASKKGMGKKEMIDAFISSGAKNHFRESIERNPKKFQKRTGTWIDHLDDLVDSFWAIETFREKELI
jgi:hypothetical protein